MKMIEIKNLCKYLDHIRINNCKMALPLVFACGDLVIEIALLCRKNIRTVVDIRKRVITPAAIPYITLDPEVSSKDDNLSSSTVYRNIRN